ncbi:MAG: sugar ABC transporter ATP-binding protein [Verrucomicrobia bacterium]|nr:sugar ABC transporter ATP-binding protein [Verrucomicrobiota bacterium]
MAANRHTCDTSTRPYVLEVRGVAKAFAGVQALAGVGLGVYAGEVHALVGENGAGKSTLMKIVAGLEPADAGELWRQGRRVHVRHPAEARRLGMAMIHQELMPFPDLSVAENLLIGHEPAGRWTGWIDRRRLHAAAAGLLDRLGADWSPETRMGDLGVAEQQLVEIARALAHRAEVVIMDEPTAALAGREVARLFGVIGELRQQGVAVIYISHKIEEVLRLADRVTVLRDGRSLGTYPIGTVNRERLIALMVGRELGTTATQQPAREGPVALAVRGLGRAGKFDEISFQLRQGEVLGLAGLMGAGRTDLAHALAGLEPAERGEIWVQGRPVRLDHPRVALDRGIALVSEDRKRYGLVLCLPAQHNLTLANLRRCCRGAFIRPREENRVADERLGALGVRPARRLQPVQFLSGGNQQKVALAKALFTEPQILILDEPTRGIDIAAKADVYALVAELARAGKAILLISSELPELLTLSHRILVLRAGRLAAELDPRRTTQEEILQYAMPAS